MDIVGYSLLLKEGKDRLPEISAPIFNDMDSIATREYAISGNGNISPSSQLIKNDQDIQDSNTRYHIKLRTKISKAYVCDMSSNDICNLPLKIAGLNSLVLPVHGRKRPKNSRYHELFSRLFEFGYIEKARSNGVVQARILCFIQLVLGEMLPYNLLPKAYDWLDNNLVITFPQC